MTNKDVDIPVNDDIIEKKSFLGKLKSTINTYTNMKGNNIEHRRNIEIYEIIGDIVSPLSCCHDKFSKTNKGDFILIIDDSVWIQDDNLDTIEQYSEVSYSPEFIRINTTLFKKI